MKSMQQIEDWIEAIESSDISEREQTQIISEVVDFWKFATVYDSEVKIVEKGVITFYENGALQKANISSKDFILTKRLNPFETIIAEIEEELLSLGTKYLGLYAIRFHNLSRNFQEEDLALVKAEILSAIKGDLIFYKYIYKLNKIESTELKIFKNDLGILKCSYEDIQKQISKIKPEKSKENQWLVLLLDAIDHDCNSFLFEKKIKKAVFKSHFEKVFLFDFYKSEIIQLQLNTDRVANKISESISTMA